MKISYAIPVCNEAKELQHLLSLLIGNIREEDEIVVQTDLGNTTKEVYEVIKKYSKYIKVVEYPLNADFSEFKNNLKRNCSGDWIFQIDADEYLNVDFVENLPRIIEHNPNADVFLLARINTVEGITKKHIKEWNWQVDDRGRINFPDTQMRILKNTPKIEWKNKVHEVLTGYVNYAFFPTEDEYCIIHHKSIDRQEKQNAFYNLIS